MLGGDCFLVLSRCRMFEHRSAIVRVVCDDTEIGHDHYPGVLYGH